MTIGAENAEISSRSAPSMTLIFGRHPKKHQYPARELA